MSETVERISELKDKAGEITKEVPQRDEEIRY